MELLKHSEGTGVLEKAERTDIMRTYSFEHLNEEGICLYKEKIIEPFFTVDKKDMRDRGWTPNFLIISEMPSGSSQLGHAIDRTCLKMQLSGGILASQLEQ